MNVNFAVISSLFTLWTLLFFAFLLECFHMHLLEESMVMSDMSVPFEIITPFSMICCRNEQMSFWEQWHPFWTYLYCLSSIVLLSCLWTTHVEYNPGSLPKCIRVPRKVAVGRYIIHLWTSHVSSNPAIVETNTWSWHQWATPYLMNILWFQKGPAEPSQNATTVNLCSHVITKSKCSGYWIHVLPDQFGEVFS